MGLDERINKIMNRYFTVKRDGFPPMKVYFDDSMEYFVDRKKNPDSADRWYNYFRRNVIKYFTKGDGEWRYDYLFSDDNFIIETWFTQIPGEVEGDHIACDLFWWDDPIDLDEPVDLNPWETGVTKVWMHIVLYSHDS